jgi:hypothetical protein
LLHPFSLRRSQTNAILYALHASKAKCEANNLSIKQLVASFETDFDNLGLSGALGAMFDGTLARPRSFEIAMTLNRLRLGNLIKQAR